MLLLLTTLCTLASGMRVVENSPSPHVPFHDLETYTVAFNNHFGTVDLTAIHDLSIIHFGSVPRVSPSDTIRSETRRKYIAVLLLMQLRKHCNRNHPDIFFLEHTWTTLRGLGNWIEWANSFPEPLRSKIIQACADVNAKLADLGSTVPPVICSADQQN